MVGAKQFSDFFMTITPGLKHIATWELPKLRVAIFCMLQLHIDVFICKNVFDMFDFFFYVEECSHMKIPLAEVL